MIYLGAKGATKSIQKIIGRFESMAKDLDDAVREIYTEVEKNKAEILRISTENDQFLQEAYRATGVRRKLMELVS